MADPENLRAAGAQDASGAQDKVRAALLQMTTGIDPQANAATVVSAVRQAARDGAQMLFTPEMSGLLDRDRDRGRPKVVHEKDDAVLSAVREAAAREAIWVHIGSLAVRGEEDGRFANRAFVINASGDIVARYDKMHMFDVTLDSGETWRESSAYAPGDTVTWVDGTPLGRLGLAICYDIRFPALFDALGRAACDAIAIPAAFTVPTGQAHWHVLQRARAVEASAFVISAAQTGLHEDGRRTYGHSLAIDPWGKVLLDMGGDTVGVGIVECDMNRLDEVRRQLPSLANRRSIAPGNGAIVP